MYGYIGVALKVGVSSSLLWYILQSSIFNVNKESPIPIDARLNPAPYLFHLMQFFRNLQCSSAIPLCAEQSLALPNVINDRHFTVWSQSYPLLIGITVKHQIFQQCSFTLWSAKHCLAFIILRLELCLDKLRSADTYFQHTTNISLHH